MSSDLALIGFIDFRYVGVTWRDQQFMGGGLADTKTFCLKRLNVVVWGWYTTVMNGERNEKILCRVQQCIPIHKTCLKNTSFPSPPRPWAFPLLIIWSFSYTLAGKNGASYKQTTTMTMTTWWKKIEQFSTCPFRNDAKSRVFSLSDNGKPVFIWNFTPFTMLSMEVGSGVVTGHFSTFAHWRNLQEKI